MLMRRVIACLDVHGGRVVKGTRFVDLRDCGDPVERAERYGGDGADEIVFLDISATVEERATTFDLVRRAAGRLSVPLTLGGGIRGVAGMEAALRSGADKVAVNSAAVARPTLIEECAARFGAQCVVLSVDAQRVPGADTWEVVVHGGRTPAGLDAVAWCRAGAALGAGEILLTSVDHDGGRRGYDLDLVRAVASAVAVPVVASGGGATAADLAAAYEAGAEAALVAGVLHDEVTTLAALKHGLAQRGFPIRRAA